MTLNLFRAFLLVLAAVWTSTAALATCTINSAGMSMTPGTANSGTYVPPTAPSSVAVAVTISGTYTTNASAGTCTVGLSFQRASYPPATMANNNGGGTTLPYTISTGSGGSGSVLLFTGGSVALSNIMQYPFASAGANLTNRAFTVNLTIYVTMQPGASQASGNYTDNLTAWVFNILAGGGGGSSLYSRAFTVTGTVTNYCTIGGVAHPTADNATIPITSAGAVNTATINKSYASVACNAPATVQVTSQNGAVTNAGSAPTGFTNLINYSVSATFSGATATLNTATNAAATGAESGTAVATTGSAPSGTLSVAITPQANASKLIAGTYSDILTITIVPQ